MNNECDRNLRAIEILSSHVRSRHVSLRFVRISVVISYSARSLAPLGLDWQIQTEIHIVISIRSYVSQVTT